MTDLGRLVPGVKAVGRLDARGWILLSLLVRAVLGAWVISHQILPLYDEAVYLQLASGWQDLFALGAEPSAQGVEPKADGWAGALGDGRWPPLHPLSLGLLLSFGVNARWLGVLLGALTTGIVFAISHRLAGRRAAGIAAGLHAFAPAFLFYSHSLWSETLALFLALSSVLAAIEARKSLNADRSRALILAALSGAGLGLLALTRVALLPWVGVVSAWLLLTTDGPRRRRILASGLCLAACVTVLSPWIVVQAARFDHLGLSTLSGYNLALGNHAAVPPGHGSSWGHRPSTFELRRELDRLAAERGSSWQRVAADYALDEARRRPIAAMGRGIDRLRMLIAPDVLPIRHLVAGVYPALPPPVMIAVIGWILLVHLGLLGFGVAALLGARFRQDSAGRSLLLALIAVTLIPPALSLSATRLFLPVELLMLPAIGAVLAPKEPSFTARKGLRAWGAVLAVLAVLVSLTALPLAAEAYWRPSAQKTAPWLGRMMAPLGLEISYSDRYRLQATDRFEGGMLRVGPENIARWAPRLWIEGDGAESGPQIWPASVETLQVEVSSRRLEGTYIELIDPDGEVRARWLLDRLHDRLHEDRLHEDRLHEDRLHEEPRAGAGAERSAGFALVWIATSSDP